MNEVTEEMLRAAVVAPLAAASGLMDKGAGTRLGESGNEVLRRPGEHLFDADEVQA